MIDHKGYGHPPAAGIGAYIILRGLWSLISELKPEQSEIVNAHRGPSPAPIVTPPPVQPKALPPPTPIVRWSGTGELLAWRAWRLGLFMDEDGSRDGIRLMSLSAPCIWDGPVARAEVQTFSTTNTPSGIYALKPAVGDVSGWAQNEHCWVTGTVALSGRVVEHALGYRAECAVIRDLRLAVGTHLVVRDLDTLRWVISSLEERYQAPVDAGLSEREAADRMLTGGFRPHYREIPSVSVGPEWRYI